MLYPVSTVLSSRHLPRRLRSQGAHPGRERNAGADVPAQEVRRRQAVEGREDCRVSSHDNPNRVPDGDADRVRRRNHLVVLQHLLYSGLLAPRSASLAFSQMYRSVRLVFQHISIC